MYMYKRLFLGLKIRFENSITVQLSLTTHNYSSFSFIIITFAYCTQDTDRKYSIFN